MLHLENPGLKVTLLDPLRDRALLGSRYCVGGYIWQVEDRVKGALLSGPQYPKPDPSPWNGQGLPEAFEIALGQHRARVGEDVWVIGVGKVRRESPVWPFHVRDNPRVVEFAPWKVEISEDEVTMVSEQAFQEWALRLERRVSLRGRVLDSATTLRNTGGADIPLRWFAHPFFPHAGLECFGFDLECAFPFWVSEGGGFRWNGRGWVERKGDYDWNRGCYQLVVAPFGFPLEARQNHPLLGEVKVECRFPLAFLPIWANERCVSFEPYHHTVVQPGAESAWSMRYHF
jgi:hypothetical protein